VFHRGYVLTSSLYFVTQAHLSAVSGIGYNVTRAVSVVWVNRRTPGPVRATMHSFLSQAETLGEILGGGTLAALAQAAGIAATLLTAAALLAATGTLVARNPVPLRK
jgi:MFS transporter, DHA3 family, tetracycline resistance protein